MKQKRAVDVFGSFGLGGTLMVQVYSPESLHAFLIDGLDGERVLHRVYKFRLESRRA